MSTRKYRFRIEIEIQQSNCSQAPTDLLKFDPSSGGSLRFRGEAANQFERPGN